MSKKKVSKSNSTTDGPPSEMKQMLEGLGVKKPQKMAEVLAENGIETRQDLTTLDDELRKELDDALKAGGVNIGDRAKLKKAQVEVNEVKVPIGNGEVSVPQLVPGQAMQVATKLERVFLGMGWTGKGSNVDLDASCVAFSAGAAADMIFFQKLRNETKSLVHTGDVLSGADNEQKKDFEDMERIYVWLQKLSSNVDCLVFVANVFTSGVSFSDVEKAYVRLVNADTNQELCRVPLSGGGLKGNCLVFCKLYRTPPVKGVKGDSPWQVLGLGMPTTVAGASSVEQMVPMLQKTGTAHPPQPVAGGAGEKKGSGKASGKGGKASPPPPPEKAQKPRSVLPCVALAVAGTAGIAAATAIYMNPELTSDMMNSDVFTSGADFSADALEWSGDALVGAGDILGDGAGEVYGWAGSVVEGVDVPGFDAIGDGLGSAAGWAGDGLQFGIDGAPAVGDAMLGAGEGAVNWIGDGENWENAGGAIADGVGGAAEWVGDGENWENAGGAVADGVGGAAQWVGNGENWENAGDAIMGGGEVAGAAATDCCQQLFGMLSGGGLSDSLGMVGDAVGVQMDTE